MNENVSKARFAYEEAKAEHDKAQAEELRTRGIETDAKNALRKAMGEHVKACFSGRWGESMLTKGMGEVRIQDVSVTVWYPVQAFASFERRIQSGAWGKTRYSGASLQWDFTTERWRAGVAVFNSADGTHTMRWDDETDTLPPANVAG